MTVRQIAAELGGEAEGDLDRMIEDVKPVTEAGPQEISFIAHIKYEKELARSPAGCLVIPRQFERGERTTIRHDSPYVAFAKLITMFRPGPPRPVPGVHPSAVVHPGASLGKDVVVEPGCVIAEGAVIADRAMIGALSYVGEGAKVGEDTRLFPRVVLYYGVEIGKRCVIHSGVVIGADGFGFATDAQGRHHKIPQVGIVVVEDDVEIGANTTIDRAALNVTRIGRGSKIDNLVQIAHNVEIGAGTILAGQCGIAGSAKIGAGTMVAAQAGIVGHVTIGERAMIFAAAGVTKSLPAGAQVLGQPAIPLDEAKRAYVLIGRLPEMKKDIAALGRRLTKIEEARGVAPPAGAPA